MPGSEITYTTRAGETFSGYLTQPDGDGQLPGIVVICSIFGIDDEMKELTDAFARDGFVVSVPDPFWRTAPGPTADFQKGLARMESFDFDQGVMDFEDVIDDLRAHPRCSGRVAVLGFCFGGRYAHVAAARFGIDAAAAYHGTGIGQNLDETSRIACPVSFHFGGADPAVPMDEVKQVIEAYGGRADAEIAVYDGIGHNFSMPYKPGYDADAAKASRDAVLRCFRSMQLPAASGEI